ncbi:CDP-alcohol phosphatidyltransferase-domain-containing protein [Zopfochytrium polystomum]|nr:CDP-alcohol phosphatidyltransferase-domain-containing protein [Zopfochytrium polystomum]
MASSSPTARRVPPAGGARGRSSSDENIYLFIPNLIGYARILLAVVAFAYLPTNPWIAMASYSASALLDALDGHAARYFDQSTKFGAVLDMVTDRSTTACLLVHLAAAHPSYAPLLQFLVALDLSSHYLQMYASLTTGADSHKHVSADRYHWLVRYYYTDRRVLFVVCALDQLAYVVAYLLGWPGSGGGGGGGGSGAAVGVVARGSVAWSVLAAVGAVAGVVCVFKQVLNVVQLVNACQSLAAVDRLARAKGKGKEKMR